MAKDLEFVMKIAGDAMSRDHKKSWFSKLPPDAKKRLSAIKEAFAAGQFAGITLAAVCQAVEALLREQSWPVPKSPNTISRWLRSSDI